MVLSLATLPFLFLSKSVYCIVANVSDNQIVLGEHFCTMHLNFS